MSTPNIALPTVGAAQNQPEVTVNDAFRILDVLVQPTVLDKDLATPPGSPTDGDQYIVGATATGAWTGEENNIAFYKTNAWVFLEPKEGWRVYVADEDVFYQFSGSDSWVVSGAGTLGSSSALDADTDGTLAANSDLRVPTQKAVRTFVSSAVTGVLKFQGSTDCSANPNYPSAMKGYAWVVSVAGKIGGASGKSVDVSDVYVAIADNSGGTEGSVGSSWVVLEHNLVGALLSANNLSDLANAGTARTNLGATTVGSNLFTLANPGAITFLRVNADNSVTAQTASNFRTDLGLGTMATQAASAVAITGGAIDGTTIGATTATTGKFTTAGLGNGSVGSPSLFFSGDTNNGLYYIGTNSFGLSTGGVIAVALDSAQHVGIGTTTPTAILDIASVDYSAAANSSNRGQALRVRGFTFTDTSTAASGTLSNVTFSSFASTAAGNTVAAANATVTITNAYNVNIQGGPVAGTNVTAIGTSTGLNIAASTLSAAVGLGLGASINQPTGATLNYALRLLTNASSAGAAIGSQLYLKGRNAAVASGEVIGGADFFSDDTNLSAETKVGSFQMRTTEAHTASVLGTKFVWNATATGGITQADVMTLDGSGNLTLTGQLIPGVQKDTINTQTGSYTLVIGDGINTIVEMNVGSANNLTVPPNSSVAFPIGTSLPISQYGAGQTTVVAGSGVTIRSSGGKLKLTGQYSGATLYKRATDEWLLVGDIAA